MIHFNSPEGSAILPSIDNASLSVIRGRPSQSGEPSAERVLRSIAADASVTSIPPPQSLNPLAGRALVRVLERDHDARRPRSKQQIGAGRSAIACVRAGFERHVDSRCRSRVYRPARARSLRRVVGRPARSRLVPQLARAKKRSRSRHWDWARFGRGLLGQRAALRPSSLRSSRQSRTASQASGIAAAFLSSRACFSAMSFF